MSRAVFVSDGVREAAASIVAYATLITDLTIEVDDDTIGSLRDGHTPAELLAAAGVLVRKLVDDRRAVYAIPADRTLARLGMWVAADEVRS